ncbi:MAG: hypothetical protein ACFFDR_09270, partial [Candidatus Thorarchaeota archaeon]
VGTTITAIIGAISASVSGRQLAVAHLIFNLVTGAIAIVFIKQFALVSAVIGAVTGIIVSWFGRKMYRETKAKGNAQY